MFCSNCGSQIQPELNYCNRCGTRVVKADDDSRKSLSENLSGSLGYIGGFGLVGYIFVALVLVNNGVVGNSLAAISFFYLATLFGICFMILQQLKTFPKNKKNQNTEFQNDFKSEYLKTANTAQLEESKQTPISSVTDHTTRALDKVSIEKK